HDSTPPSSHYLFFTLPPPPELYTLLLHDALPILAAASGSPLSQYHAQVTRRDRLPGAGPDLGREPGQRPHRPVGDRGRQQVAGHHERRLALARRPPRPRTGAQRRDPARAHRRAPAPHLLGPDAEPGRDRRAGLAV